MPASLEGRLTTRVPIEAGPFPAVVALVTADNRRHTRDGAADEAGMRSRMVGLKSWARREVVVVPVAADGSPALDQAPLAWVALEDRATGRTNVQFVIAQDAPERDALAAALLDWAVEVGGSFARARGIERTQLHADANELDSDRARLLTAAGYAMVRTWVAHAPARRPLRARCAAGAAGGHPGASGAPPRVRAPRSPRTCAPCTGCSRNPSRTTSTPTGSPLPSSSSASSRIRRRRAGIAGGSPRSTATASGCPPAAWSPPSSPRTETLGEGTYLEYLGVHRSARGHGIAKALLNASIQDAIERGRTHVDLEVDDDSPTGADGLYAAMGWETYERTQSWHSSAPTHPSRLLEPPPA